MSLRLVVFAIVNVYFFQIALFGQKLFDLPMQSPSSNEVRSVMQPPPPLTLQVLFVGGHDLVQTSKTYKNPAGIAIAKENHDFIGLTPDSSGQSLAWVAVNHEANYLDNRLGDGGGMTAFRIKRASDGSIEVLEQTLKDGRQGKFFNVDFVNTVGETGMNCGGIRSPNGRIWTAEEWLRSSNKDIIDGDFYSKALPTKVGNVKQGLGIRDTADWVVRSDLKAWDGLTLKKYENFSWLVEIDAKEARAIRKQYNWGRAHWEAGAISNDLKTVYFGNDEAPTAFLKFVADKANDYSAGRLYFFKYDQNKKPTWVEIPNDVSILRSSVNTYALRNGATMFLRNEWLAVDRKTDIVYFSETGRDEAGLAISQGKDIGGQLHPHHDLLALKQGLALSDDDQYVDPYGRVWAYDPNKIELSVAIEGGPWYDQKAVPKNDEAQIHFSNPDGLTTIDIDGRTFLVICEDLIGASYGRSPVGSKNKNCELFLLDIEKAGRANPNDLIKISMVPDGAEVTGVAVTPDGKSLLVNAQHPNYDNDFPYNHSLTYAIHGFDKLRIKDIDIPKDQSVRMEGINIDTRTRELTLPKRSTFTVYNEYGKKLATYQNIKKLNVSNFSSGLYYIHTNQAKWYTFMVL